MKCVNGCNGLGQQPQSIKVDVPLIVTKIQNIKTKQSTNHRLHLMMLNQERQQL